MSDADLMIPLTPGGVMLLGLVTVLLVAGATSAQEARGNTEQIVVYVEDGVHDSPLRDMRVSIWALGEKEWSGRTDQLGLARASLPPGQHEIRVGMRVLFFSLTLKRQTVVLGTEPVQASVEIRNLLGIPVRHVPLLIDMVFALIIVTIAVTALPPAMGRFSAARRRQSPAAGRAG